MAAVLSATVPMIGGILNDNTNYYDITGLPPLGIVRHADEKSRIIRRAHGSRELHSKMNSSESELLSHDESIYDASPISSIAEDITLKSSGSVRATHPKAMQSTGSMEAPHKDRLNSPDEQPIAISLLPTTTQPSHSKWSIVHLDTIIERHSLSTLGRRSTSATCLEWSPSRDKTSTQMQDIQMRLHETLASGGMNQGKSRVLAHGLAKKRQAYSENDSDCLALVFRQSKGSGTRHSDHDSFDDTGSSLYASYPIEPKFDPPQRQPTPPGLPSFGSQEAQIFDFGAHVRAHDRRRVPEGREKPPRGEIWRRVISTLVPSDPLHSFFSSTDPTSQRVRLPKGVIARADDGSYVRSYWGPRVSGHGVGASGPRRERGIENHPFHASNHNERVQERYEKDIEIAIEASLRRSQAQTSSQQSVSAVAASSDTANIHDQRQEIHAMSAAQDLEISSPISNTVLDTAAAPLTEANFPHSFGTTNASNCRLEPPQRPEDAVGRHNSGRSTQSRFREMLTPQASNANLGNSSIKLRDHTGGLPAPQNDHDHSHEVNADANGGQSDSRRSVSCCAVCLSWPQVRKFSGKAKKQTPSEKARSEGQHQPISVIASMDGAADENRDQPIPVRATMDKAADEFRQAACWDILEDRPRTPPPHCPWIPGVNSTFRRQVRKNLAQEVENDCRARLAQFRKQQAVKYQKQCRAGERIAAQMQKDYEVSLAKQERMRQKHPKKFERREARAKRRAGREQNAGGVGRAPFTAGVGSNVPGGHVMVR